MCSQGWLFLAGGLVLRRGTVVTVGLALLGVGYGAALIGKGLDPAAGLFAAGLVAVAELAFWAIEPGAAVPLRRAATGRESARRRRGRRLERLSPARCCSRSWRIPFGGDAALGIAGVLAVLAIFAVAAVLARSLRSGVG